MPTPVETAIQIFSTNYNCSQSVFTAFAVQAGIDQCTALRLASPFGGGYARRAEYCGAVSGALMALGLLRGAETPAEKERVYFLSQEFIRLFLQKHATIRCRDLIAHNISSPEGWEAARKSGVFETLCPLLVKDAVEIVQSLLDAN